MASLWEGDTCNYALVSGPIVDQLDPSYTNYNPITSLQFGFDSYREVAGQSPTTTATTTLDTTIDNSNQESQDKTNTSSVVVSDILLPNWSKNRTLGCIDYPVELTLGLMDESWNTARTFAFIGLVLGGAGASFLFFSTCFVFSKVTWRWTGYALLLASLCQIISLCSWFNSQVCSWNTCKLSRGSKSDIASVLLWTISGLMCVLYYPDTTTTTTTKNNKCCYCCCSSGSTNSTCSGSDSHSHDHNSEDENNDNNNSSSNNNDIDNNINRNKRKSQEIELVHAMTEIIKDDIEGGKIITQGNGQSSGEKEIIITRRRPSPSARRNRRYNRRKQQHLHQKLSLSDDDDNDGDNVYNDDENTNEIRRYPNAEIT